MIYRKPKGTRDFFSEELEKREAVRKIMEQTARSYGYVPVQTPIFEEYSLFAAKSGEELKGNMYMFKDKSNRELVLRPEGTASIARLLVTELKGKAKPLKLFYFGPMFRYEQPQSGRYREFYQFGVECVGSKTVESDAEVIAMACETLDRLGMGYGLEIGQLEIFRGLLRDLKVAEDTQDLIISLVDRGKKEELDKVLDGNRKAREIIDKLIELKGEPKKTLEKGKKLLEGYPRSLKAVENLETILADLDAYGVKEYRIALGMARGLAYYTGMIFEIRVGNLGAQNQIAGGGRYDKLVELFGGEQTPATGFAFGFDRVCLAEPRLKKEKKKKSALVIAIGKTKREAIMAFKELKEDADVELEITGKNISKALTYANSKKKDYAIVIGQKEAAEGKATLKDMRTGEQETLRIKEIKKRF